MNDIEFWKHIERSRKGIDTPEEQAVQLQEILADLEPEEIRSFQEIFERRQIEAYRWDLWGAAYVINGGCSDDGFLYFRNWLIGQGREVYTQALAEPDSLADLLEEEDFVAEEEDLAYAAVQAYEEAAGETLPASPVKHPADPEGQKWEEDQLEELFPQLCARFW